MHSLTPSAITAAYTADSSCWAAGQLHRRNLSDGWAASVNSKLLPRQHLSDVTVQQFLELSETDEWTSRRFPQRSVGCFCHFTCVQQSETIKAFKGRQTENVLHYLTNTTPVSPPDRTQPEPEHHIRILKEPLKENPSLSVWTQTDHHKDGGSNKHKSPLKAQTLVMNLHTNPPLADRAAPS